MYLHFAYLKSIIKSGIHSQNLSLFKAELAMLGPQLIFLTGFSQKMELHDATLWHVLAEEGNRELTELILNFGRTHNVDLFSSLLIRGKDGKTALRYLFDTASHEVTHTIFESVILPALHSDSQEHLIRHLLIELPELASYQDADGNTLLHHCAKNITDEQLHHTSRKVALAPQHFLLRNQAGETPRELARQYQNTVFEAWNLLEDELHTRCFISGITEKMPIAELVESTPHLLDVTDASENTALHKACTHRAFDLAVELLKCGADPFRQNESGETPLYLALQFFPERTAEKFLYILFQQHADPDTQEKMAIANAVETALWDAPTKAASRLMKMREAQVCVLKNTQKILEESEELFRWRLGVEEKKAFENVARDLKQQFQFELKKHHVDLDTVNERIKNFEKQMLTEFKAISLESFTEEAFDKYQKQPESLLKPQSAILAGQEKLHLACIQFKNSLWQGVALWVKTARSRRIKDFKCSEILQPSWNLPVLTLWLRIFAACGMDWDAEMEKQLADLKPIPILISWLNRLDSKRTLFEVLDGMGNTILHQSLLLRMKQRFLEILNSAPEYLLKKNANGETVLSLVKNSGDFEQFNAAVVKLCAPNSVHSDFVRWLYEPHAHLSKAWMEQQPWAPFLIDVLGLSHLRTSDDLNVFHYAALSGEHWAWIHKQEAAWEALITPNTQGIRPIQLTEIAGDTHRPLQHWVKKKIERAKERYAKKHSEVLNRLHGAPQQHFYKAIAEFNVEELRSLSKVASKKLQSSGAKIFAKAWQKALDSLSSQKSDLSQIENAFENLWTLLWFGAAPEVQTGTRVFQKRAPAVILLQNTEIAFLEALLPLFALRRTIFSELETMTLKRLISQFSLFEKRMQKLLESTNQSTWLKQKFAPRLQKPWDLLTNRLNRTLLHQILLRHKTEQLGDLFEWLVMMGLDVWQKDMLGITALEYAYHSEVKDTIRPKITSLLLKQLIDLEAVDWALKWLQRDPSQLSQRVFGEKESLSVFSYIFVQKKFQIASSLLQIPHIITAELFLPSKPEISSIESQEVAQALQRHWESLFLQALTSGKMKNAEALLERRIISDTLPKRYFLDLSQIFLSTAHIEKVCEWIKSYGIREVNFSGVGEFSPEALTKLAAAETLEVLDMSHCALSSTVLRKFLSGITLEKTQLHTLRLDHNLLDESIAHELQLLLKATTTQKRNLKLSVGGNPRLEQALFPETAVVPLFQRMPTSELEIFIEVFSAIGKVCGGKQGLKDVSEEKQHYVGSASSRVLQKFRALYAIKSTFFTYLLRDVSGQDLKETGLNFSQRKLTIAYLLEQLEAKFQDPIGPFLRQDTFVHALWRYVKQAHYVLACNQRVLQAPPPEPVRNIKNFASLMLSRAQQTVQNLQEAALEAASLPEKSEPWSAWFWRHLSLNNVLSYKETRMLAGLKSESLKHYLQGMQRKPLPYINHSLYESKYLGRDWSMRLRPGSFEWGRIITKHLGEAENAQVKLLHLVAAVVTAYGRQLSLLDSKSLSADADGVLLADTLLSHLFEWVVLLEQDFAKLEGEELIEGAIAFLRYVPWAQDAMVKLSQGAEVSACTLFQETGLVIGDEVVETVFASKPGPRYSQAGMWGGSACLRSEAGALIQAGGPDDLPGLKHLPSEHQSPPSKAHGKTSLRNDFFYFWVTQLHIRKKIEIWATTDNVSSAPQKNQTLLVGDNEGVQSDCKSASSNADDSNVKSASVF